MILAGYDSNYYTEGSGTAINFARNPAPWHQPGTFEVRLGADNLYSDFFW